ncbi:MAG: ABC transporter permease [Promethearchaeota archaeon]
MANMLVYITKRILMTIPMILILIVLTWFLAYLMPGDPTSFFPPTTSPSKIAEFRELWGLDKPWYGQLWTYLQGLFHGDLGESIQVSPGAKVVDLMAVYIPRSIQIAIFPIMLIPFIGIKTALVSVKNKDKWQDTFVRGLSVLLISTPAFFFALILQLIFGYWLPTNFGEDFINIPVIGLFSHELGSPPTLTGFRLIDCLLANDLHLFLDTVEHLILPVACQTLLTFAVVTRQTRTSLLDILDQDYIRTARAKGCSRDFVYNKHALRNALIPATTVIVVNAAYLLAGSVIIEISFGIRGMGMIFIEALTTNDYWLIVGNVLYVGIVIILGNLLADCLYTIIDPRIIYK